MNTEITDAGAAPPAGWIFFDAECAFCLAIRRRCGRLFERHGFVWLPLQTPGTAERLGIGPDRLTAEMWVLPVKGPPRSGVDAWISLMGHVPWLRPLAPALCLPGIGALARAIYRWVARHRHCLGGKCRVVPRPPPRGTPRHAAFFELP